MTGTDWAEQALADLLDRAGRTLAEVGDRFPLHADPTGGLWFTTARGSWAGGFWAGLLAIRAAVSRSPGDLDAVLAVRDRLAIWADADTVCRGMIFWFGETVHRLGLAGPGESATRAGRALADTFDARLGAVPWGSALGGNPAAVRPDGAAGTVSLLAWSAGQPDGPERGAEVAAAHLETHLRQRPSDWSRGRAWLFLASVEAAHWLGPDLLEPARQLAGCWSAGGSDSSADCIAAVALIRLGELDPARRWRTQGARLLRDIVDAAQIPDGPARGGIGRGRYDDTSATSIDHELVWGDYFAAIGLGVLTGAFRADVV